MGLGSNNVDRKERYARDADYRARVTARQRAYDQAHKHEISVRRQDRYLKSRYGLSREDYDALLARQGGVCAICAKPPEKTLCVDHCHATGKVRGLLCRQCNFGLGCLGDDQAALIASLVYLGRGAFDGGGSGSAAQRALLARAALPPARIAILTQERFAAAAVARAAGIGRTTLGTTTRGGATLPTNAIHVPPKGGDMSIDDIPPDGGNTARPMWEALAAELRRESDDGEGAKAAMLQLIARKLAAKALDGDLAAIREIFDRMDGKSVAGSAADESPGKVVFEWKDPE
jgi:Autographiviridae endonuclease VII